MTRSDKWQKRPCVVRYWEWCDKARKAAEGMVDPLLIHAYAHIELPESWSEKKKEEHYGRLHRQRPDSDNLAKSLMDALLKEDSSVAQIQVTKLWCEKDAEERIDVFLLAV